MSLPSFYFLLALAAVIPSGMSPVATFFLIVAIMASSVGPVSPGSFAGWPPRCARAPTSKRRARWAHRARA